MRVGCLASVLGRGGGGRRRGVEVADSFPLNEYGACGPGTLVTAAGTPRSIAVLSSLLFSYLLLSSLLFSSLLFSRSFLFDSIGGLYVFLVRWRLGDYTH